MGAPLTSDSSMPGPEARNRVAELLADYLLTSGWVMGPGTDGLVVDDVVGQYYLPALSIGHVPDSAELVIRHPELADAIAEFFKRQGPHSSTATGN